MMSRDMTTIGMSTYYPNVSYKGRDIMKFITRREFLRRYSKIVGHNVRKFRVESGFTQEAFIYLIRTNSRSYLSAIENGQKLPSLKMLLMISYICRVPPQKFLEGDIFNLPR
jgi:DNA-binding XRE family transcriptional regulator